MITSPGSTGRINRSALGPLPLYALLAACLSVLNPTAPWWSSVFLGLGAGCAVVCLFRSASKKAHPAGPIPYATAFISVSALTLLCFIARYAVLMAGSIPRRYMEYVHSGDSFAAPSWLAQQATQSASLTVLLLANVLLVAMNYWLPRRSS